MSPTARWRLAWSATAIGLAVLDLQRERADIEAGRDYVNGTTFSCFVRWIVGKTPGGGRIFDVGLSAFHWWFRGHVLDYPMGPAFSTSCD